MKVIRHFIISTDSAVDIWKIVVESGIVVWLFQEKEWSEVAILFTGAFDSDAGCHSATEQLFKRLHLCCSSELLSRHKTAHN